MNVFPRKKKQRKPRRDQSELESMGEKLETLTNEGNLHVGSISILVFQAVKMLKEFTAFDKQI